MKKRKGFILLLCVVLLSSSSILFYRNSYPDTIDVVSKLLEENRFHKMKGFKTIHLFHRVLILPDYQDVISASKDNAEKEEDKFNHLLDSIKDVPYVDSPTSDVFEGANCQTMTIYVQDWCDKNEIEYKIIVEPTHVYIMLKINNTCKIVNFNRVLVVYDEYIG